MERCFLFLLALLPVLLVQSCREKGHDHSASGILSDLARPIEGRSMRSTSTKTGENGKKREYTIYRETISTQCHSII